MLLERPIPPHQQTNTVISDRFQPRLLCVGLFSSYCPQLRATILQFAIMPPVSTRVIASRYLRSTPGTLGHNKTFDVYTW